MYSSSNTSATTPHPPRHHRAETRATKNDTQVREFTITADGIALGEHHRQPPIQRDLTSARTDDGAVCRGTRNAVSDLTKLRMPRQPRTGVQRWLSFEVASERHSRGRHEGGRQADDRQPGFEATCHQAPSMPIAPTLLTAASRPTSHNARATSTSMNTIRARSLGVRRLPTPSPRSTDTRTRLRPTVGGAVACPGPGPLSTTCRARSRRRRRGR